MIHWRFMSKKIWECHFHACSSLALFPFPAELVPATTTSKVQYKGMDFPVHCPGHQQVQKQFTTWTWNLLSPATLPLTAKLERVVTHRWERKGCCHLTHPMSCQDMETWPVLSFCANFEFPLSDTCFRTNVQTIKIKRPFRMIWYATSE